MSEGRSDYLFKNWDETLTCEPRAYHQPETEDEVVAIVKQVAARRGTLRAVGAGHSWSPLVPTDDTLINLDELKQLIAVDPERHRVTVQAGIRLKDLNEVLANHGLALANLGSITEQSIAGAMSTATHGSGLHLPNLPAQVAALRLVTADGRIRDISAEADAELLSAARVSLGALGVVTQVTLQCVPAYRILREAYPLPFDEALAQLDQILQRNERVRLYWFANTDVIQVITYNRTERPVTPRNAVQTWFREVFLQHDFLQLLTQNGYAFPGLVMGINQFAAKVGWVKEERVDRSDLALTIPMPPPHQETEYALPVARTAEAVRKLRHLIERAEFKVNFPLEVRFVAADDIMLSPTYQQPSCYLGGYTYGVQFAREFFAGFEGLMRYLGGRPHWGKHMTVSAEDLRRIYPRYDRWNEIRRALDPHGVFANAFIRDLFDAPTGAQAP